MGFGPSPFSAWQWSKRGRFYPTPVASWPGTYPLLQYSIFCSFPTTTHWSTSSQTRLAHFWQSSPCFCCYAWNVQVKQLNCRCFRFLLDFDFFFTILIWKTEVFRTLGFYKDISVDNLEFFSSCFVEGASNWFHNDPSYFERKTEEVFFSCSIGNWAFETIGDLQVDTDYGSQLNKTLHSFLKNYSLKTVKKSLICASEAS